MAPRLGAGDQDQCHGGVPRARVRGHRPRQRQPLLHAQPERHQQAEEEVQDHHREILQVVTQRIVEDSNYDNIFVPIKDYRI